MHGRFQSRLFRSLLLAGVLSTWLAPSAAFLATAKADEAKPSWACLPEDTFALLRIPAGNKVAEALRDKTKIGNVLFDPARIDKIKQAMAKDESEDFEQFTKNLARYDLKLDDLTRLFHGEAGAGLLLPPGDPKLLAMVAWLEPDHDLTGRLLAALDKVLEENQETELVRRKDIELAGQKVIHLIITPPKAEDGDDEEQDAQQPGQLKLQLGLKNAFSTLKFDVLLTKKEGRLLMALGMAIPTGDADRDEAIKAARERLKDLFARFLVAHDEGEEGPKLKYLEAAGVRDALPSGLPLVEMMFDFRPLMKMASESGAKEGKALLKGLGIDELGVLAYRTTFERSLLRSGMFLAAPSPRSGLFGQLADGRTLTGKPPAWVPADMLAFGQFAIDLGKVYDRIKDLVADLGENQNTFDTVEVQIKQFLGTDLSSLLSSLGNQHSMITLPPKKTGGNDDDAAATGSNVFVWKLTDEAVWKRVLQTAAVLMQKDTVEEQGFQGIRYDQGQVRFGVFVGRGHLIAGGGSGDAIETILAAVRNPPTGSSSLAGSKLLEKCNELLPPKPCLAWSVSDLNLYGKTLRKTLLGLMDYLAAVNEDADQPAIDLMRSLIPSEDELDGALGVAAASMWADDRGLSQRSVSELPAP